MSSALGTPSVQLAQPDDLRGGPMATECTRRERRLRGFGRRELIANFDGGNITSFGGAVLLHAAEKRIALFDRITRCFTDHRSQSRVEHPVRDLLAQRIFGLALGEEDLNDHDELSKDPLLATVVGKREPTGRARRRQRDQDRPLASSSTLNRLELTPASASKESRYKKTVYDGSKLARVFLDVFLDSYEVPPEEVVLDFDHTDDQIHGRQEGSFFHAYYDHHIYLPLYVFCGDHLLAAQLRTANGDPMRGVLDEMKRIVNAIRERWPETTIVLRGDSAFARDETMAWCEEQFIDYIFGLRRNKRLERMIEGDLEAAREEFERTGRPARRFAELDYDTLKGWARERRVVAKAEHLKKGANPRFVVTSLEACERPGKALYEGDYCARGEAENRIKEQQLDLFADRTSAHTIRANQLRLWFSALAYLLVSTIRRLGLAGTKAARLTCGTIRKNLLKVGARVRVTARRIWIELSSAYPRKELFMKAWGELFRR